MDQELFNRLVTGYRQFVRILDPLRFSLWSERGLTMQTLRILSLLQEKPGQCPGDIATQLGVTRPTVTGLTDRMIRDKLIERREDSQDRRMVRLFLSDEGHRISAAAAEAGLTRLREVFSRLPTDRLETLATSLQEVAAANAALQAERNGASM